MIQIKKSETADTRTCDWRTVSKEALMEASKQHKEDVRKGMEFIAKRVNAAGIAHDWSKVEEPYATMFHGNFSTGFSKTDWWELHQEKERHHLQNPDFIQEDVNLVDVIEMIVDGVMAGLARSGEYRRETLPEGLLEKAFENTIALLLGNVSVSS